ncbi:MAG: hypothetical protein H8E91_03300 [Planctomycetes bacterium]|nr:hypothetical protein [Planctomycetota bacterium]
MHRAGINENDVQPEDILCDYCQRAAWSLGDPCIEGHRGSIVCGSCLTQAFTDIVLGDKGEPVHWKCRMCLELRDQLSWHSKIDPEATICLRCIKQSATALEKSKHWEWSRPTGG